MDTARNWKYRRGVCVYVCCRAGEESVWRWKGTILGHFFYYLIFREKIIKLFYNKNKYFNFEKSFLRAFEISSTITSSRIIVVTMPILGEGNGNPLQYSRLENPVDRGAWWASVHRVAQSRTWLKRLSMHACMHALEKEMATQSSILAWRIPGAEEPGGLPSMGSHRVEHDWSNVAAVAAAACQSSVTLCLQPQGTFGVMGPLFPYLISLQWN